ncbi:MAG TPA: LptA/OstA family protein [Candidatus Baltobacteraceae bacterium]|nr:LptA/OstA family protein [Candidatus Baltobacteraceae bacterium]
MKRTFSLIAIAAIGVAAAAKPPAKPPAKAPAAQTSTAQIGTWTVEASEMAANMQTGQFSVPVKITMTRSDGSTVQGDRAVGNFKQKRIALYGNVSVHDVSGNFGLQSGQAGQSRGPSTLTTDQLLVNDKTRLYDARGNVHYEQGDSTATSDAAHLNDKTHELTMTGKVHVVQGDRSLDADSVVYNTQTGQGSANNNVQMQFPGTNVEIATPKPITIKGPAIP